MHHFAPWQVIKRPFYGDRARLPLKMQVRVFNLVLETRGAYLLYEKNKLT